MKLQPPGAGLPNAERLVLRFLLIPFIRIFGSWNIAIFLLKRELAKINALVASVPPELCVEQNVIDRTLAIEDDSRRFSVNMVLEHLVIAGTAVSMVIQTLSKEKEFTREIKIEAVKPRDNAINQIENFNKFYDGYLEMITNMPKKQSKMTKKHPWFIGFNNYDWSVFMYMHTFIHRRQIESIIAKLGEKHDL